MDRFIAVQTVTQVVTDSHLKSSMDRFIDLYPEFVPWTDVHLKSSMDRFIEDKFGLNSYDLRFKIQYG